ncbi:MAG: N-acetyl-gamma-glutamyl-phosphate reductase [Chloroherpetonaceae bacterium]|nr:N-acetyl-gamma-glutamyl-phosphate reductase [Chloroherpetonaceae bacterium]MDW8438585.1 N-acetyl-gamma-glutamyl-phosphate reductase [Chloroherpetonaceae bacterium]
MKKLVGTSVVGASGYSGAELLRFLLRHRGARIDRLFANASAGKTLADLYPDFRGRLEKTFEPYSLEAALESDCVFLALPSGEAMTIAPKLIERGKTVIDLGGDFRLRDVAQYEKFYKRKHAAPNLLPLAVYGLAEWNAEKIKSAKLVANPGCYPTSALLPLLPLLKERLIEPTNIVIVAMSGVSGAGRKADIDLSFAEVSDSVKAYRVGEHQHLPEIKQTLEDLTGQKVSLSFVPHLIPTTRGIYATIHATLAQGATSEKIFAAFERYYREKPFVRYLRDRIPELKGVLRLNFCDIGFRTFDETNQLILCSAIDNLVKGAAGQAVQNFNLIFGFDETESLP